MTQIFIDNYGNYADNFADIVDKICKISNFTN